MDYAKAIALLLQEATALEHSCIGGEPSSDAREIVEALRMAIKAMRKAIPKTRKTCPTYCPVCDTSNDRIISHLGNPKGHPVVYCWNCGQAIKWNKEVE